MVDVNTGRYGVVLLCLLLLCWKIVGRELPSGTVTEIAKTGDVRSEPTCFFLPSLMCSSNCSAEISTIVLDQS